MSDDRQTEQEIEQLLEKIHALRWSDYRLMIELGEKALVYARREKNPLWIARSLNYIGWAYNSLDIADTAFQYNNEALQISKEYGLLKEYCTALGSLSYSYIRAEETEQNLSYLEECIRIAEENDFHELLSYGYNNLGLVYMRSNHLEESLEMEKKSLQVILDHDLDIPKSYAYGNMSIIHFMKGNYEEALRLCQFAYEDAVKCNIVVSQLNAQGLMSEIHILAGNLDQAMIHAQNVQQIAVDKGFDPNYRLDIIGKVYAAQGKYQEALEIYHQSESLILKNRRDLMPEFYTDFSDAYKALGNYQQAFKYLQYSIDARNHIVNEGTERRVLVLKTLQRLETTKREAKFQESQNEVIQAEMKERLKRQRIELSLEKQVELMGIKTNILTRLSHEFRTPVTILQTSFELLTRYHDRLTPENKTSHIQRIEEQFYHIKSLLDDTLDVLQLDESHHEKINPTLFDLNELVISVIRLAEKRTRTSNRVSFNHPNSMVIYQDSPLLEQIIINLLTNALKFSDDLVLLETSITPQDQLIITVKDQGIGIPPDEQEAIFEVLIRGSNLDEIGGNGMGLALVKQGVELLDGEIFLRSDLNIGTEISVILPIRTSPDP